MSPFLQRALPSPRPPDAKSQRGARCGSGNVGGPGAAPRGPSLQPAAGRAGAGSGERAQRCPGVGNSRRQAGLLSPREEAALLGEAVVSFVPEVTLSGFASAPGSCRECLPASGRRGSPQPSVVATFMFCFVFSLCRLYSPQSPPARGAEGRPRGAIGCGRRGWGRRARRVPLSPDAATPAWPSRSVPGGTARGCSDARCLQGSARGPCEPRGSKPRSQPALPTPQRAPFPRVKNWVNSALASSGPSRLLGSNPARGLSPPHWPGDPQEPVAGELAHMVPEARVALPSGARL